MLRIVIFASSALCGVLARHHADGSPFVHTASLQVPPGPGGPCDGSIPGSWTGFEGAGRTPLGDLYSLTWSEPSSPGAWTATMEQGGGWGVGHGQFNADNSTTTISFDSGVNLTGNVTANCTSIYWDNDSSWSKVVPKPVITDVHIIAMSAWRRALRQTTCSIAVGAGIAARSLTYHPPRPDHLVRSRCLPR